MLKTYLIVIPQFKEEKVLAKTAKQENMRNAERFMDVFANLHESMPGVKMAFEMVVFGQNIGFCFTSDPATCEVIGGQIYAMDPDADILEIPDYTRKIKEKTDFAWTGVGLLRNDLYPLKMFDQYETDSLSGILNVLAKCQPDEGVWLQIVTRPRLDTGWFHFLLSWRKRFERIRRVFRTKFWFKKGIKSSFRGRIKEKTEGEMFHCNLRVAAFSDDPKKDPRMKLRAIFGGLQNFNTLDYNKFRFGRISKNKKLGVQRFRTRAINGGFLLCLKEITTLFHLPNEQKVPNLIHVLSRRCEPPSDLPVDTKDSEISFFGETNFHGRRIPFGIRRSDRRRHLYTVGKSGSGKSKLLELLIQNDIKSGKGIGVLDPHGDLVDNVLRCIPENRLKDVVVFDPSDMEYPICFNPLAEVPPELKIRVTIGFIEIFKKLFGANWTPRLEHVLRYTTLALLDTPGTTILSILKMLTDKNYRQTIVRNIQDNVVKNFWVNEFAGWSEKFDNEAITPLLNKVGQFVSTNMIRNIVGQPENKVDFRDIMDNQKIVLMKVSKGILGEENAALMGSLAITKIYQAAMSRADTPEADRIDFYFYVDEFQNFATDTFDEILSEARKYRLDLTIAHQFLGQLSPKIRTTVFGNVGSMVTFRVGGEDAKLLEEEYTPRVRERDIINLAMRNFYCKMSVDGELREAFSGRTLNMQFPEKSFAAECIEHSRKTYCRPLHEVEQILQQWEEGKYDPKNPDKAVKNASLDFEEDFNEPIV
ncbi:MAG: type IV secretory system conjugative DNA transfer family protein [Candidatus Gracilibacteria bacterium]|nr:type IV secretory system conjugative DNA transfer family protein [Candidatus Gracilibacteria bacterium]